ncbi:antibiotic biosynthesis monooxygenase family protein [Aliamphritea hakodatensis]|uniref:antibiotic biosynthesis monooxygenase family protein n=1 Tax=Aliamphritea hakodatensis TaxID=2895352 RepID=UPI0022FD9621|nr:antibiotic biosynthesis monooxygenase [Aliamphritea hakodatensis]
MYIAMNRFKIALGREQEFIGIWRNRDSQLHSVDGFESFSLIQGESNETYTLMASHVIWRDKAAFDAWLKSDAFKQAHANAGKSRPEGLYLGPPQFEGFSSVL